MAEIGTATIKVLPDLSDFSAAMAAVPDGFTVTEVTEYERDEEGQIIRETRTKSIRRQ